VKERDPNDEKDDEAEEDGSVVNMRRIGGTSSDSLVARLTSSQRMGMVIDATRTGTRSQSVQAPPQADVTAATPLKVLLVDGKSESSTAGEEYVASTLLSPQFV
jgi:hypothetical protein